MKTQILVVLMLFAANLIQAQDRFPKNQISINAFRNPSIGLEYHRKQVSIHAGYYPTNFTTGVTTEFLKAGVTYWLLPWGKKEIPSSFYIGSSYLLGLTRDYKDQNALALKQGKISRLERVELPFGRNRAGGRRAKSQNQSHA